MVRVLMLGWEFPPFITGGLGTACHGLTRAMARQGTEVTFLLPKAVPSDSAEHVRLLSPSIFQGMPVPPRPNLARSAGAGGEGIQGDTVRLTDGSPRPAVGPDEIVEGAGGMRMIGIEAGFVSPYQTRSGDRPVGADASSASGLGPTPGSGSGSPPGSAPGSGSSCATQSGRGDGPTTASHKHPTAETSGGGPAGADDTDYHGDLITQVQRYAAFCQAAVKRLELEFDVIHAHDWMTYPAGMAIARMTGKPLAVHVHSTEFDRSGEHVNQQVYDVERRGMHSALRVITVSQLTKNIVMQRYGVPEEHIKVCYNGVDLEPSDVGITNIESRDRIVLYFGRITYQKGPEYFIRAAKRVLEHMDNVKFVVAGSGDLAQHMIESAASMGFGNRMLFTGFLRGRDIKRVFAMADLYVMPSISEPFGIAPLEAMSHDVPVLISKTSGVSEILVHALKVDFWDIDDMADKIIAVLRHPPLSRTLREHGALEVRGITWDGAAQRCDKVYREMLQAMAC